MEPRAFVRIYEQPPVTIAGLGCDEPCIYSDELRPMKMKFLHSMIRVSDPAATVAFFQLLGLEERRRMENEPGRFTLIFLGVPGDEGGEIELTWNWDENGYGGGRNFGHLAYQVDDIYETCQRLMDNGVAIDRPPRDGRMAFVRSPDNISIELLQKGGALAPTEPWSSMPNTGEW
jgi:lactoylglutathione lyase